MCKQSIYLAYLLVFGLVVTGSAQTDPNLTGWWPLNEGTGEVVADLSGNGNDGAVNNAANGLGADGSVRRFINIYKNGEDIRYLDRLNTELVPGDVIAILPAVAGG